MMITLIQNKTTTYRIVIPENSSLVEQTTAKELATYLEKVYGLLLPVVKENKLYDKAFYVGHTAYAEEKGIKGDSVENWRISVCDQNVILTGGLSNKDRGIAYAVYHFLEDVVGIRWWSWFEEYIPLKTELTLADDYSESGTPYFEYRNMADTFAPVDLSYVAHSRLNAWCDDVLPERAAHPEFVSRGGIKYSGPPSYSHTLPRIIPIDDYYDEHPEWFAYYELSGTRLKTPRHGTLYCLTNEELIQFTAEKVMSYIEQSKKNAEKTGIEEPCFFSVSMADSQGYCQCEKCKEVGGKAGKTGYQLQFVNAVAELVGKKYPEAVIHTLIYWDYIEPPMDDTVPAKNVIVHFADLKVDLLRDIEAPTNKESIRLLTSWSNLCEQNHTKLYIWDYFLQQYPNCMMPYFTKIGKNFKFFYEHNVRGSFIEHETGHISDFWTMTQWLTVKAMENPYEDFEALTNDFIQLYYGAAAPYIKQYIDLLEKNLSDNACRVMVFEQANITNYVNYKTMKAGLPLLAEAAEKVKDDDLRLKRVHLVMTCFYRTLALRYDEFQKIAASRDESIAMTKEKAIDLVISYLPDNLDLYVREVDGKVLNEDVSKAVDREIAFMERFRDKPKPSIAIPEELLPYGVENVYAFAGTEFFGLAGCGMLPGGHRMGESIEFSQELGHEILKISPGEMPVKRSYTYIAGSKQDEIPNPLLFYTDGNQENISLKLYQEDLAKEQYHLYHVGDLSNVSANSSTIFRLFDYLGYCVGISNLYEVFPSDRYSVYISMKVSGSAYGGHVDVEDALCLNAVFIVRK